LFKPTNSPSPKKKSKKNTPLPISGAAFVSTTALAQKITMPVFSFDVQKPRLAVITMSPRP